MWTSSYTKLMCIVQTHEDIRRSEPSPVVHYFTSYTHPQVLQVPLTLEHRTDPSFQRHPEAP